MTRFTLWTCLILSGIPMFARAQSTKPGVIIQNAPEKEKLYPFTGALEFERSRLDFAPQSIGVENCSNIPLNNTTDKPRVLTQLKSLDPEHFYVSSPSDAMLPLTLGGNSSLFLNVCFKTDKIKNYESYLLAIFQTDTVRLLLTGRGVPVPVAQPIPKEVGLTVTRDKKKKHDWLVQLAMPRQGVMRLSLENTLGKTVRTFPFNDTKAAGFYEVAFNEKGDDGKQLEKGNYYFRMEMLDLESKEKFHASKLITLK